MRVEVQVGEDGHVDLGPEVLERLGLRPGERATLRVDVEQPEPSVAKDEERRERARRIKSCGGILYRPDRRPLSVEEMNDAIANAVVEEYRRGLNDRGD